MFSTDSVALRCGYTFHIPHLTLVGTVMPRCQAVASPARRPLPRAGEALASWPAPRAPSVPRAAVRFPTLPALLSCYLPEVVYLPMPAYGHGVSCPCLGRAMSLRHGALCTAHLLPHTACGEDAGACILQLCAPARGGVIAWADLAADPRSVGRGCLIVPRALSAASSR